MRRLFSVFLASSISVSAIAGPAGDSCDAIYPVAKLVGALDGAEASFSKLDVAGFSNAIEETLLFVLPCLSEPVSVDASAQTHRMMALRAYSSRRDDLMEPSLLASRYLEPSRVLSVELIPEGHEFRERYDGLSSALGPLEKLRRPRSGSLWVDGTQAQQVASERATIIQYADESGQLRWTQYHLPGESIRGYPLVPKVRNSLLASAGVQAGLAVALLGVSAKTKTNFEAENTSYSLTELEQMAVRVNTFRTASVAMAGLAGGTFGLAIVFSQK